jgi:uncharacterized membrane protein YfcA
MDGMEAIGWGLLIAAGWLTGFCSGLLGIGGGLVVVPAMIVGLPMLGVSGSELSKIATATSLLLVIPTSIASAQAHASRGSLDWACWEHWRRASSLAAWSPRCWCSTSARPW